MWCPPARCGRGPKHNSRSSTGTGRSSPNPPRSRSDSSGPIPAPFSTTTCGRWGSVKPQAAIRTRCSAAYRDLLDDPSTVEAICEDYRAGATIDRDHDDADLGKRKIQCPVLLLWSGRGALPRLYGDVLDVWRPWAEQVAGRGLDATHFLVEDQPEEVAKEMLALLSARRAHLPTN